MLIYRCFRKIELREVVCVSWLKRGLCVLAGLFLVAQLAVCDAAVSEVKGAAPVWQLVRHSTMFDVYVDTNPANFMRQGSKVFSVWSATGTNGAVDMEFDRLTFNLDKQMYRRERYVLYKGAKVYQDSAVYPEDKPVWKPYAHTFEADVAQYAQAHLLQQGGEIR